MKATPKDAITMNQVSSTDLPVRGTVDDPEYEGFLHRVSARFALNTQQGEPLFTTDADGLFQAYLDALPPEYRQHHTCHACRQFIERFGHLVTINAFGRTAPAIWDAADAPDLYRPSIAAIERIVRAAKVTGAFLSSEPVWGLPRTGVWQHLSVKPLASRIFKRTILTAGQAMAEKREDFGTVMRALSEFSLPVIEQAVTLLEADSLYRSEKVIGPAKWLRDLHVARDAAKGANRANVVWLAVATAPAGFCHPRSSMIGTLIEDIAAGKNFDECAAAFKAKMHPLRYQRPQAAPAAGAIAQAEKIVAQLGAAGSLARRFCRLDEVRAVWRPTIAESSAPQGGGIFAHLKAKNAEPTPASMVAPAGRITWDKFSRTVLADAERIEVYLPSTYQALGALTTAVNADAPPIYQWDREDDRNPVAWYIWHSGAMPSQVGLSPGWNDLDAITLKPSMWGLQPIEHQGKGLVFVIQGARETRQAGAAIFPECLRSEFHGIRSVIEAYSRASEIAGIDSPHACGLMVGGGTTWNVKLRVTASGGRRVEYVMDRWD